MIPPGILPIYVFGFQIWQAQYNQTNNLPPEVNLAILVAGGPQKTLWDDAQLDGPNYGESDVGSSQLVKDCPDVISKSVLSDAHLCGMFGIGQVCIGHNRKQHLKLPFA